MGIKVWKHLCIALLLFVLPYPALASDMSSIRLLQVHQQLPVIEAYADIFDNAGNPVPGVQPGQITATLGANPVNVSEVKSFADSGEGVAYIYLVDISQSIQSPQYSQVKTLLDNMTDALTPKDQAAIITLGSRVDIIQDFTADKASLKARIAALAAVDNQTQLNLGLERAIEMSRRQDASLPGRRQIILLSDGQDDFKGGVTKDEVRQTIKSGHVPIDAVGFAGSSLTPAASMALDTLGEFARISGGLFFRTDVTPLTEIASPISKRLQQGFVIKLSDKDLVANGKTYRLQLTLTRGSNKISDGFNIVLLPGTTVSQGGRATPFWWQPRLWYYAGGIIATAVLIGLFFLLRNKRKQKENMEDSDLEEYNNNPQADISELQENRLPQKGIPIALTALGAGKGGKRYEAVLVDMLVIGSSQAEADLVITSDYNIATKHCVLGLENGFIVIRDLETDNGTHVNGVPITGRFVLQKGDLILMGRTELRLSILT